MKVKAKKEHQNGYGEKYVKKAKDEYHVPDAAAKTLIAAGLVEEVKEAAEPKGKPKPKPGEEKPSDDAKG